MPKRTQKEERSGTFTGAWLEREDRAYLVIIGALAAGMVAAIVALVSLR